MLGNAATISKRADFRIALFPKRSIIKTIAGCGSDAMRPSALLLYGIVVTLCISMPDTVVVAAEAVPAHVVGVNPQSHAATVRADDGSKSWAPPGPDVQKAIGHNLEEGDLVLVTGDVGTPGFDLSIRLVEVGVWSRLLALIGSAIVLLLLAAAASRGRPQNFCVGADNRVSNSQSQVVLWFGTALTMYLATLVLRLVESDWQLYSGIGVPPTILAMTGVSGLTFAGSKMIAVTKNGGSPPAPAPAPEAGKTEVAPGWMKQSARSRNWWTDLFTNDQGELDFGDFQMIIITMLAVVIYFLSGFLYLGSMSLQQHVSIPDVDGGLLAAFGIGQGAYLAKKAALPVGTG